MILLAFRAPDFAHKLPLDQISSLGISGIFFLYGLKLSPGKLLEGLANWKLHLLIQLSTFLIFPLLVLSVFPLIDSEHHLILWLAVFFLAALPSTVSSSVVMVSIAGGNIAGAIFNASISGLIGILVTPLLMGIFLTSDTVYSFNMTQILFDLLIRILTPVFLGLIMHRFWGSFAERHKKQLTIFDKSVILIIVYKSFSESFSSGVFEGISLASLLIVGASTIGLFAMVYMIISFISGKLRFSVEDRITALFCGSKKSLVHGTVFSSVMFGGASSASIFLVPIMIYHAFQLAVVSVIARKYGTRSLPAVHP
jgi:sodium/bile acid cotransporter 7